MSRKFYEFYCNYPIISRSVTGATLFLTADVAAQQVILKRGDKNDFIATGGSAIIGLASGSVLCVWYKYLEGKFGSYQCFRPALNKTILDQIIFKPIFTGIPLLATELRSLDKLSDTFNLEEYKKLILPTYAFTPWLMFLTFRFVHRGNRTLMTQIMGAVWWFTHTIKKEKSQGGGSSGGGDSGDSKKTADKGKDDGKTQAKKK